MTAVETFFQDLCIIDTVGMSKAERFRLRGIGASDSPIIAGCGYKGKTRLSLWFERTGQMEHVEPSDDDLAERMRWGDRLEDDIADELTFQYGIKWAAHQLLVRHPEHEWMTCTLDGLTTEGTIWDYKARSYWSAKDTRDGDPDTLLPSDIIQANHQMAVCGKRYAHWAQFSEMKLKTFTIERDEEIVEMIIQLGREFMEHVRSGTPPAEFDPEDEFFIRKRYTSMGGGRIFSDDSGLSTLARNYDNAKAAIKEMEAERDRAKAAILMAMKDAKTMNLPGGWSAQRSWVNVKGDPNPKPKLPGGYIKFSVKNGDRS